MSFPLKFAVSHRKYLGTADEDELGNEIGAWADQVEVKVFGWEPPKSTEPALAGHDRVLVDIKLYAPRSMGAGPADRVWLDGKKFDVIGYPEDPNNNSFWAPGLVTVNLRRAEG